MADQDGPVTQVLYTQDEMEAVIAMASRNKIFLTDRASSSAEGSSQEFEKELFLEEVG